MTQFKKIIFAPEEVYKDMLKSDENMYAVPTNMDVGCFPNYGRIINMAGGTGYTVGSGALAGYKAGWVRYGFANGATSWHGQSPQLVLSIGGVNWYASYFCAFTMAYVTEGDYIYTNSAGGNTYAQFIPMKEA